MLHKASSARTVRDFDASLTAPAFGYATVDAYYLDASSVRYLHGVRIPLLVLNAEGVDKW